MNKARVVKVCEAIALQSETEICTSLLGIIIGFKQSWQKKKLGVIPLFCDSDGPQSFFFALVTYKNNNLIVLCSTNKIIAIPAH